MAERSRVKLKFHKPDSALALGPPTTPGFLFWSNDNNTCEFSMSRLLQNVAEVVIILDLIWVPELVGTLAEDSSLYFVPL